MRHDVEELTGILRAECAVHERLIETARLMNAALRREDPAEVRKLSTRYDAQTAEVEVLEEKRLAACDALTVTLGLGGRHANLAMLTDALPPELRPPLEEVRARLRENLRDLSKINVSNQILLQESLENISRTIRAITAAGPNKYAPYKREGSKSTDVVRRNIVNRTA